MSVLGIAGLGASVVGNIVGGIKTAEIAKKQQQSLDNEKAYSESLFNKEYYQDELNRSENASYLRQLHNNQNEENTKAQRTAAITGATPEETAAQAKNAGSVYANAVNKLAGVASQRKDQALARFGARRSALVNAQNGIYESKKNSWGTFMGNASKLGTAALSNTSSPLEEGTAVEETPNFV